MSVIFHLYFTYFDNYIDISMSDKLNSFNLCQNGITAIFDIHNMAFIIVNMGVQRSVRT